jgi:hypothetical protein
MYLRAFADADQVVWRQRGRRDEVRNIRSVTFSANFYGFVVGGRRGPLVEHWLDEHVEAPAAPALRRLSDGMWPPSADDRDVLARFVSFQLVRTPLVRDHMRQAQDDLAPLLWSSALLGRALQERPLSDREQLQVLRWAEKRTPAELFQPDQNAMLRTMVRKADELVPVLRARPWSLLRATQRCLVAGDNPVGRVFPAGDPAGFTGLAPADAELQLPVSPQLLLILERDGLPGSDAVGVLTAQAAAVGNDAQARAADRGVLRHPTMAWPRDLVLGPRPPRLPTPTVTTRLRSPGPPTFPATYPPANDPRVAALLTALGASDVVE